MYPVINRDDYDSDDDYTYYIDLDDIYNLIQIRIMLGMDNTNGSVLDLVYCRLFKSSGEESLSLYVESSTNKYMITFNNSTNDTKQVYSEKEITITLPACSDNDGFTMLIVPVDDNGDIDSSAKLGFVGFKEYINTDRYVMRNLPSIHTVYGFMSGVQSGARPINTEIINELEYRYTYTLIPNGCKLWWEYIDGNVTHLDYMFMMYDTSITKIDISHWPMNNWNVTSLAHMFANCSATSHGLEEIILPEVTSWRVKTCEGMFQNNFIIKDIDLSMWDAEKWNVTNFSGMFNYDIALKTIHFPQNLSYYYATNLSSMFENCLELDVPDIDIPLDYKEDTIDCSRMFYNCRALKSLRMIASSPVDYTEAFDNTEALETMEITWSTVKCDICFNSNIFTETINDALRYLPAIGDSGYTISIPYGVDISIYNQDAVETAKYNGWTIVNLPAPLQ